MSVPPDLHKTLKAKHTFYKHTERAISLIRNAFKDIMQPDLKYFKLPLNEVKVVLYN